jgi:pimeloyl-ACP methyl ester carboxylesterase
MSIWSKRTRRDFVIPDEGIDVIETPNIGGIQQTLLIQSYSVDNPVLLFIHGGPSMPLPGVSCRGVDYALATCTRELAKYCTLVFWDQRGTGRSFHPGLKEENIHMESFMQDALVITDYLREKFRKTKIHLAAHSWGTVLGLQLIHRNPEKYLSYSAISQIINWVENDRLCYKWLMEEAQRRNHKKMLAELKAIGEPPYLESVQKWKTLRKWLIQNKSMFYDAGDGNSPTMMKLFKILLNSEDYRLIDIFNSFIRGFKLAYNERMIRDIQSFDFAKMIQSVDVPVQFIHGRQEKHVMPELVVKFYERLSAPKGKRFLWAEQSSHTFHPIDARMNESLLLEWITIYEGNAGKIVG